MKVNRQRYLKQSQILRGGEWIMSANRIHQFTSCVTNNILTKAEKKEDITYHI